MSLIWLQGFMFSQGPSSELLGVSQFADGDLEGEAVSRILKAADDVLPTISQTFLNGVSLVWKLIQSLGIQKLTLQNLEEIKSQLTLSQVRLAFSPLFAGLADLILDTGQGTLTDLPSGGGISLRFDLDNPLVKTWMSDHTGDLIKHIQAEQLKALKQIVSNGYTKGIPPADLAKEIEPYIGLTPGHAQALANFRASLITQKVDPSQVQKLTSAYGKRLLRWRANTIARSETITAANAGQLLAWETAKKTGYAPSDQKRRWITAKDEKVCLTCGPMNGQSVLLTEPFVTPGGKELDHPGAHPNCRCTQGLVFAAGSGVGVGTPSSVAASERGGELAWL